MRIIIFFIIAILSIILSGIGQEGIKLFLGTLLGSGEKLVRGGRDAVNGEFPFHVSIQIIGEHEAWDGHICGGSILNKRTILTAAHCFDYVLKRGHHEIVAGNNKLKGQRAQKEQRRKIDQVFKHPKYSAAKEGRKCVINDIAIVRVQVPFTFNDFVNAARLPDADVYPTGDAQVTGWGAMASVPGSVDTLQVAEMPLLSPMECEAALEDCVGGARTLLCTNPIHDAGTLWEEKGGGPLFQGEVVVGIVSFPEEDRSSAMAIYTRVSAYRKWIDSKLTSRAISNSKVQNEL